MSIETQYTHIVSRVLEYIDMVKETDKDISLLEIISEFCFKNDLEVYMVGDAIASDVYLSSFIKKDCEFHNIIKSKNLPLDKW